MSKVINSDPQKGLNLFGLTERGKSQIESVGTDSLKSPLSIFSSDFRRTAETSAIICRRLGIANAIFDERLRERYFGDLDGLNSENYKHVWKLDTEEGAGNPFKVESVEKVLSRLLSLVSEIENRLCGFNILFVSHGDPMQILATYFKGLSIHEHRSIPMIQPGELRHLNSFKVEHGDVH